MAAEVLGISGSPIPDSNTDRAVKEVLKHCGGESEFIKLSNLDIVPCRACLACAKDNVCAVQDDGRELMVKFRQARAFVLGAYTPYSSLDARSKGFMERMYCLRHQKGLNQGKIGASVITTACPPGQEGLPPAPETAAQQIGIWMMAEGMTNIGSMTVVGNVPCIRCGHGDDCCMSGLKMIHGPDAALASVVVHAFEEDEPTMAAAKELGENIRAALAESG